MYCFLALLYGGPDTVMPIASSLAAVIGIFLLLWQRVVSFIRSLLQTFHSTTQQPANPLPPSSDSVHHGS